LAQFQSDTYTVKRFLGKGSFADVYLATNRKTEREVVIKVSRSPESLPQFLREFQVLSRFNSPFIAGVHSMEPGDEQNPAVLELEFVSGRPLGELDPPAPETLERMLLQLLTAVRYLHTGSATSTAT